MKGSFQHLSVSCCQCHASRWCGCLMSNCLLLKRAISQWEQLAKCKFNTCLQLGYEDNICSDCRVWLTRHRWAALTTLAQCWSWQVRHYAAEYLANGQGRGIKISLFLWQWVHWDPCFSSVLLWQDLKSIVVASKHGRIGNKLTSNDIPKIEHTHYLSEEYEKYQECVPPLPIL